jgi:hypothetical protein
MKTLDLISEIKRLPINKRFFVVEETIKSIKEEELNQQIEFAVNELYNEYVNNTDLTAFTSLDLEHFYESK